jgi:hypothetical protein
VLAPEEPSDGSGGGDRAAFTGFYIDGSDGKAAVEQALRLKACARLYG